MELLDGSHHSLLVTLTHHLFNNSHKWGLGTSTLQVLMALQVNLLLLSLFAAVLLFLLLQAVLRSLP